MGRPTAGWGSINCAGAGQPGRVWQARTAPGVAMLPGEAGINVRKTARYAGKDCDPLQGISPRGSLRTVLEPLSSYGPRHGATPHAHLPVSEQLRITTRNARNPMCRPP